jgi:hypothetical protein
MRSAKLKPIAFEVRLMMGCALSVLPVALRSLILLAVNSSLRVFVSPMENDLAPSVC